MTGGVSENTAHTSVIYWLVWSTCKDGDTSSQGDVELGLKYVACEGDGGTNVS